MERVLKAPVLTGALAPPHPTPAPGEAEGGGQEGADGQSSHCKAGLGCSPGPSWALAGLPLPEPGQPRSLQTQSQGPQSGSVQASPVPTAQKRHSRARGRQEVSANSSAHGTARGASHNTDGPDEDGPGWGVQAGAGRAPGSLVLRGSRSAPRAPHPSSLPHSAPSPHPGNRFQGLLGGFLSHVSLSS